MDKAKAEAEMGELEQYVADGEIQNVDADHCPRCGGQVSDDGYDNEIEGLEAIGAVCRRMLCDGDCMALFQIVKTTHGSRCLFEPFIDRQELQLALQHHSPEFLAEAIGLSIDISAFHAYEDYKHFGCIFNVKPRSMPPVA